MKLRSGLVLTGALTLVLGGCAASGGGSGGGTTAPQMPQGENLEVGEPERDDDFTRDAQRNIEAAAEAATEEEAQPLNEAALTSARMAIENDSTNPKAYYLAAQAALALDEYEAAGDFLDRAEELRPLYTLQTEAMRERAWVDRYQMAAPLLNQGDYAGALTYFEQADAVYEGRPAVKYTMGQLYAQQGDFEKSIEAYRGALEIINSDRINEQPDDLAARWREWGAAIPGELAQTLIAAGDDEAAAEALTGLLAEDPGNIQFLRLRGTAYADMDSTRLAMEDFNAIVETPGLSSADYYAAGVGFYRMQEYQAAADAFETAVGASPNDRDALEFWARSLNILWPAGEDQEQPPEGVLEELQSVSERWMELDPYNPNAMIILAQAVNRLGNNARAGELVSAIEELPVNVDNLRLQRYGNGGAFLVGGVRNKTLDPGTTVTLEVTFYGADGTALETQSVQVQMGEADAVENIRVESETQEYVGGVGYEVIM